MSEASTSDRLQSAEELAAALESVVTDALAGKSARTMAAFVGGTGGVTLIFFTLSALMVWTVMPSLREMGMGFVSVLITAAIGLVLGTIELVTRGRYHIARAARTQ